MNTLSGSIALLMLLGSVRCQGVDPTPVPVHALAQVTGGELRLFSGEDVQLRCSVPEDPLSSWRYQWFLNGVLTSSAEVYHLKNAHVLQTGSYTCQGEKDLKEWPYLISSLQSDLLNVHVDGGWVLLQAPTEPLIIEEVLTMTCRVRDDPLLVEVNFYKGDVKIRTQKKKDLVFPSATLDDQGTYWCKATWLQDFKYQSAQSLKFSVIVLDKLSSPVLTIDDGEVNPVKGSTVVLRCSTQLNTREKGHTIEYYYMNNATLLGPSSSKDTHTIQRVEDDDTGVYTCKARVRVLNLERWSNELKLKVEPSY
ncbi:high affinity immunoglobulin gamma Fc receptor I-like isoform X1 [Brachyhypopomus gauderio]|uniref:high affinity immunoglobulin gamma Fc receptor I-like isoform X1 n=1 Tax=Brachyhypopomus gauderio TaxID=698409 RepID=UPI0040437766